MVGVAQLVERWIVAPVAVGSIPIAHPFHLQYRLKTRSSDSLHFPAHLPQLVTRHSFMAADDLFLGGTLKLHRIQHFFGVLEILPDGG